MKRREFVFGSLLAGALEWNATSGSATLVATGTAEHGGALAGREGVDYPIDPAERRLGLRIIAPQFPPGAPERYGAAADCMGNTAALLAAATDSTAGLQAAIDYAAYGNAPSRLQLRGGGFKTTDTLQLGYGTGFNAVVMEGQGYRFRGESPFAGTAIFATKVDRPAINIQGARGTVVRGLAIVGLLGSHITRMRLAEPDVQAAIDDTVPESWDDPAMSATAPDSRFAPYAGVAIDAYSGPRPTVHYPDVRYPAWLSTRAQYGKDFSSDVCIEDCYIGGFTVGVANQPCDADGNGDFTRIERVYFDRCKWGVSVGNSQARNTSLTDVKMTQLYCCLTNRTHGKQRGKIGAAIPNLSVARIIKVFEFGGFYAAPIHFSGFYAEALWQIGSIDTRNSSEGTIIFSASQFNFNLHNAWRGTPGRVLTTGYAPTDLQFQGCYFMDFISVAVLDVAGTSYEGCYFRLDARRVERYEQIAHNALAGGLVTRRLETPARSRLKHSYVDLDTGTRTSVPAFTARWSLSSRSIGIPYYCERVAAASEFGDDLPAPHAGDSALKSDLARVVLNGRVLTLQFKDLPDWVATQRGPDTGDVILDEETGSTFFVRARSDRTVTAVLQNNYRTRNGRVEYIDAISATTGRLWWRNARIYTPRAVVRGTLGAAGALLVDVGDDEGSATGLADIQPGDSLLVNTRRDRFIDPVQAVVVARDVQTRTLRLSQGASAGAPVRRRLDFFVRRDRTGAE